MGYRFRNMEIPQNMVESLLRYKETGLLPGDFLQAVICNDLVEACGRADDYNIDVIPAYASFLYSELPITAWGSREKMLAYAEAAHKAWDERLEVPALAKGEITKNG